ncbi:MAG TPA: PaaI family thioesterase [Alphaproteobacteria bacterium]|nr:PaaI family thioesterase [Alphaproteobacteria bacterium]
MNDAGIIHGGMVMSFTDNLLARTVPNSGASPAVTLHMTTDFVGPAHLGDWVEGKVNIVHRTRTLVFVEGEVFTRKRLLMTAKGVFRHPN